VDIELAIAEAGPHSIVLGGDYPVSPIELGPAYMMRELSAANLATGTRRLIERDNALRLLGLDP
jgi:predicted TIM-barrel fold metal-dependent hydrolase